MLQVGQGLWLMMNYADGGEHNYKRPFLIIEITKTNIHVLNVSSLNNKSYKLGYDSNLQINNFKPPFKVPSFIKLDAVYIIEKNDILERSLLCHGTKILSTELTNILTEFRTYKLKYGINTKVVKLNEILNLNPDLQSESFKESASDIEKI